MTCETPVFEAPPGIELVAPSTEGEFRGVAEVQWEAYEECDPISESAVERLRRTAETGGVVVLAREAETGEAAGAGLCVAPYRGVTELAAIGVREQFRRRGIAAAMAGWLTDAALAHIAKVGYDPDFGARPLKRVLQKEVADPVALALLKGDYHDGDVVMVDATSDGSLSFSRRAPVTAG